MFLPTVCKWWGSSISHQAEPPPSAKATPVLRCMNCEMRLHAIGQGYDKGRHAGSLLLCDNSILYSLRCIRDSTLRSQKAVSRGHPVKTVDGRGDYILQAASRCQNALCVVSLSLDSMSC